MNSGLGVVRANVSSAVILINGVPVDFNCLTVPGSLHWTYANGINNDGGINGQASDPDHGHAPRFLATPVVGVNDCSGSSVRSSSEVVLPRPIASMLERSGALLRLGLVPSTILH